MKFRIYRNIRTKKWSIQEKKNGSWKVSYKLDEFAAENCVLKVSEAGRQRVIRTKRKNVHAFIYCDDLMFANIGDFPLDNLPKIEYSPYTHESFVCKGAKLEKAETIYFCPKGAYFIC